MYVPQKPFGDSMCLMATKFPNQILAVRQCDYHNL